MFKSIEANVTFDIKLTKIDPDKVIRGTVVTSDGNPATDVAMYVCNRQRRLNIENGVVRRDSQVPRVRLDENGDFRINRPSHDSLLLAICDQGIAHIPTKSATSPVRLEIQPWGKIEGRLFSSDSSTIRVSFRPLESDTNKLASSCYINYRMPVKANGRFSAKRVIPGPGYLSKLVSIGEQSRYGWQQRVDVSPGKTQLVRYGGDGRTVMGRIAFDPPIRDLSVFKFRGVGLVRKNSEQSNFTRFRQDYFASVESDGQFQFNDIPSGEYELSTNVYPFSKANTFRPSIGSAKSSITIDANADSPQKLEPLVIQLNDTLDVGDSAPGFAVTSANGESLRFKNYQGKLLVIDFRSVFEESTVEERRSLKDLHLRFGTHPRFAMLTMAIARNIEQVVSYQTENHIAWPCAMAGTMYDKTCRDFMLQNYPVLFVVGPDGKVFAKSTRVADLIERIEQTLADDDFFLASADTQFPNRYVAVHAEKQKTMSNFNEAGLLVLSSKPTKGQSEKNNGRLQLFSTDGTELASADGLQISLGHTTPLAVDVTRGRIYHSSQLKRTLTAYDALLRQVWSIKGLDSNTIELDSKTGDIWCSTGSSLKEGETVVFDVNGNEKKTLPFRPLDIAHDPVSDTFWLAGYTMARLARDGTPLWQKPVAGWTTSSIAIDSRNERTWIGERDHPDVESKNRLWFFEKGFESPSSIELDNDPGRIAFHPQSQTLWVSSYNSLTRIDTDDLNKQTTWDIEARGVTINQRSGDIWISTKNNVIKIDQNGNEIIHLPIEIEDNRVRIFAF